MKLFVKYLHHQFKSKIKTKKSLSKYIYKISVMKVIACKTFRTACLYYIASKER